MAEPSAAGDESPYPRTSLPDFARASETLMGAIQSIQQAFEDSCTPTPILRLPMLVRDDKDADATRSAAIDERIGEAAHWVNA